MKNQYNEEKPRLTSFEYIKKHFKDYEGKDKEVIEIVCEHCGKHLCMAVEFDLEGSYFVCDKCFAEMEVENG